MQLHIQKEHLETLPQQQICHSGFFLREPVMVLKNYNKVSELICTKLHCYILDYDIKCTESKKWELKDYPLDAH